MSTIPGIQSIDTGEAVFAIDFAQIGGDDLTTDLKRNRTGIVIERYGVPIATRTYKNNRRWTLNMNAVPVATISSLQQYYQMGTIYLYPDKDESTKHKVLWLGEFNPTYVKPVFYRLLAVFEEML